jgi:hypothetical protein
MKIPMFLTVFVVEKFNTNPNACGWNRLEPRLPRIIHASIVGIFTVVGTRVINTDDSNNPQNINALWRILSAKNPKIGCKIDAKMCEQLKIIVAIGIEMFACSAINGIIGLSNPV